MTHPEIPQSFREAANRLVAETGLAPLDRESLRQEVIDHLLDASEAGRCRGLTPHEAQREALERFGPPDGVRKELFAERMLVAWRDARRMPRWVRALILADATLGVLRAAPPGVLSGGGLAYAAALVALGAGISWLGVSGLRLGFRLACNGVARRAPILEAAAGSGTVAGFAGLLLSLGPGFVVPRLCDAIDALPGGPMPVAFTAMAAGFPLAVLYVARGYLATRDRLSSPPA